MPTNKIGKPSNNMTSEERIMSNSISLYNGELSVILPGLTEIWVHTY